MTAKWLSGMMGTIDKEMRKKELELELEIWSGLGSD